MIDAAPFDEGRDGERRRPVAIDVIDAVLRVILDDENGHVLPERGMRQPVDNLA